MIGYSFEEELSLNDFWSKISFLVYLKTKKILLFLNLKLFDNVSQFFEK